MQYLTLTRILVIQAQVEIALTRTTYLSEEAIDSILKGIEKQWIDQVYIYGLDSKNMFSAQLIIEIDWYEHNLHNCNGNRTVVIAADGSTWIDNTAIELHEALSLFNDYVVENSLKTKCQTSYGLGVNCEDANRILGRVNTEAIRWKDNMNRLFEFNILEIKELRVGFYCLSDCKGSHISPYAQERSPLSSNY
ncbi:hypothetical protein [Microcoleus sp.]|uniref:hypothetical protein n=1 Tax=Microcoleus sp. TaxID=44472 RepID=UPI0035264087